MMQGMSFRSWLAVSLIFWFLPGLSTRAFADYILVTRDGKTLKWDSLSPEDGNYCTWENSGKFCLPQSDVTSVREVRGPESSGGTRQVNSSSASPRKDSNSGQSDKGQSGGATTRSSDSVSGDLRSNSGRGGSSNAAASSTARTKEVADWVEYSTTPDGCLHLYDKASIKSSGNSRRTVMKKRAANNRKCIVSETQDRKQEGLDTKGYENYSYTLNKYEFDCSSEQSRHVSKTDYDSMGNILETFEFPPAISTMKKIARRTTLDKLYGIVCK